jgi:hypothetical protein
MKPTIAVVTLSIVLIVVQDLPAQSAQLRQNSVAVQPILSFENLLPTQVIGLSGQYEFAISQTGTIPVRVAWFRDPLVGPALAGSNGFGLSTGYQHYFSQTTNGWHVGPFVEWILFEYIGYMHSNFRGGADIGILGGHKWTKERYVFDIGVRTAWYSPATFPAGRYFPSKIGSRYNSQMILSVGYLIN